MINEQNGATRFAHIKATLANGGSAQVGIKSRYVGVDGIARFERDFADNLTGLHYAQCRVFEAGTKYVIRTRIGAN